MLKNIFFSRFERSFDSHLPLSIQKIVYSVASNFNLNPHLNDGSDPTNKRLEFAHATLHMRIYQHYGAQSSRIMQSAHVYLDYLAGITPEQTNLPETHGETLPHAPVGIPSLVNVSPSQNS